MIKGTQEAFLNKKYVGVNKASGLGIPDFEKISYSYDIKYIALKNHLDLKSHLASILQMEEPIICDVFVDPDQRVIPKLVSGKPIHDMAPQIPSQDLKKLMF